jgi:hypothetical protein
MSRPADDRAAVPAKNSAGAWPPIDSQLMPSSKVTKPGDRYALPAGLVVTARRDPKAYAGDLLGELGSGTTSSGASGSRRRSRATLSG